MGLVLTLLIALSISATDLETARDRQDRTTLTRMAQELRAESQRNGNDPAAHYRAALAESYLAEVATEQRDKVGAKNAAEAGIEEAQRAVDLKPGVAEYHRVLGTLCGQVIPANVFFALKYAKCAQESINRAIQLDPNSPEAYVGRGVGNFYLPPQFGGGVELAIKDFEKAIQLNPKSADAYLWLGIALRKANRNADARRALEKSLQLNPNRVWAKQQLDKTPAS